MSSCLCELGMSALIRGNAPDLGDREEEGPPTGQELSLLIHRGAEFSRCFDRNSGGKKKRIKKRGVSGGGSPSMKKLYKGELFHSMGGRLAGGLPLQLCILMLNGVERRVVANLQLKQG